MVSTDQFARVKHLFSVCFRYVSKDLFVVEGAHIEC